MSMKGLALSAVTLLALILAGTAVAQKKYGPGVTDTEIKIGQTMPYSGSFSAYGTIGKAELAYFQMINERGGVNGRKINLVSLDDGYSPPRTFEQTRRLVEQEEVLAIFNPLGTASNTAIQKYLNARKVPHLFVATGASKWDDPKNFPWTIGWQPNYATEGRLYARYILETMPAAKIGVLYQNDDYGKDFLQGVRDGLGELAARMIVAEVTYEGSDPTVDSQIVTLKGSGADTFINVATPKFAAQAIRKAYDVDWKPVHFLNNISASIAAVLRPAGLEKAKGIISMRYFKDASDPQWQNDADYLEWVAWMQKYYPDGNVADSFNVYAYVVSATLVEVLKRCGDEITRENLMRQVSGLDKVALPMLLPGISLTTGPNDYAPLEQMQLIRFDGERWAGFGEVLGD